VTEWTESKNWMESTETYEAERSASTDWTVSAEIYDAKRSAVLLPRADSVVRGGVN
jgi:hypothetical protein